MNEQPTTGIASASGHWYQKDGSPAYQVKAKAGHLRNVTLADARKLGLLPGVTSISRLEAAPGLERWKIEQHVLAALTLPEIEGETLDARKGRVYLDAAAQADKARERGTELHASIERVIKGGWTKDRPFTAPVLDWIATRFPEHVWSAEHSFGCHLGYGGKLDCLSRVGTGILLDFKTKDFGESDELKGWPEQAMQLAAYRHGVLLPEAACVNLMISTRVPGLIVPIEWKEDDLVTGFEAFKCLLRLWQIRKGFDPSWSEW